MTDKDKLLPCKNCPSNMVLIYDGGEPFQHNCAECGCLIPYSKYQSDKDMTWEQLVDWCRTQKYDALSISSFDLEFYFNYMLSVRYNKGGDITFRNRERSTYIKVGEHRTPYQMYQIIKNLTETKE